MTVKDKIIGAVVDNSVWILSAAIVHLLGGWIYIRSNKMGLEKDVKIGDWGDVDFALQGGNAIIKLSVAKTISSTGTQIVESLSIVQPEKVILDKIVSIFPAGVLRDMAQKAEDAELARSALAAAAPAAPAAPSA